MGVRTGTDRVSATFGQHEFEAALPQQHCHALALGWFALVALTLPVVGQSSEIHVAAGAVTEGDTSQCSLVDAVAAANASTTANLSVGACTPTGTPDGGGAGFNHGNVILLAAGRYVFTSADNDWYGPNALPPIGTDIVIVGDPAGSVILRDTANGTPAFRFFYVGGGQSLAGYGAQGHLPGPGSLTLARVTLYHGLAKGGSSYTGGGGMGAGGAIYNQGALSLRGVTLHYNTAAGGNSGLNGDIGGGGGTAGNARFAWAGGFSADISGVWGEAGTVFGEFGNGGVAAGSPNVSGGDGGTGGGGGSGGDGVAGLPGEAGGAGQPGGPGAPGGQGSMGGWGDFGGGGGAGGDGGNGGDGGPGGPLPGGGTAPQGMGGMGGFGGDGGFGGFGAGGGGGGRSGIAGFPNAETHIGGNYGLGGFGAGNGAMGPEGILGPGAKIGNGGGGAGLGGAIFNEAGIVDIMNSTLVRNAAHGGFSLVADSGDGYGGALFNLDGIVSVRFSTFANNIVRGAFGGNTGHGAGGSIYNLNYPVFIGSPAVETSGVTAQLFVAYSIIAGSDADNCGNGGLGIFTSHHNVIQQPGNCALGSSDLIADPLLSALVDYGDATPIMRPQPGSPVVDAAASADCPGIDQRGVMRPQGPTCDIGAVEVINADFIFADGFESATL